MPKTDEIEMAAIKATIHAIVTNAKQNPDTKAFEVANVVIQDVMFEILKQWHGRNVFFGGNVVKTPGLKITHVKKD